MIFTMNLGGRWSSWLVDSSFFRTSGVQAAKSFGESYPPGLTISCVFGMIWVSALDKRKKHRGGTRGGQILSDATKISSFTSTSQEKRVIGRWSFGSFWDERSLSQTSGGLCKNFQMMSFLNIPMTDPWDERYIYLHGSHKNQLFKDR